VFCVGCAFRKADNTHRHVRTHDALVPTYCLCLGDEAEAPSAREFLETDLEDVTKVPVLSVLLVFLNPFLQLAIRLLLSS